MGLVTPDSFRLSGVGSVLDRTLGDKDVAIRSTEQTTAEGDPTEEVPVDPDKVDAFLPRLMLSSWLLDALASTLRPGVRLDRPRHRVRLPWRAISSCYNGARSPVSRPFRRPGRCHGWSRHRSQADVDAAELDDGRRRATGHQRRVRGDPALVAEGSPELPHRVRGAPESGRQARRPNRSRTHGGGPASPRCGPVPWSVTWRPSLWVLIESPGSPMAARWSRTGAVHGGTASA